MTVSGDDRDVKHIVVGKDGLGEPIYMSDVVVEHIICLDSFGEPITNYDIIRGPLRRSKL